jgi:hypothetical protein
MHTRIRILSLLLAGTLVIVGGDRAAVDADAPSPEPSLAESGPRLWVTPLELDFGPVGVGDSSASQSVTITNLGDAPLTDFAGGAPADSQFHAGQTCAPAVAPGESCQYVFTFSPTAAGTFTASSNSSTNAGSFSITLHGTGVGAGLTVSPTSLDFGSVRTGNTSPEQSVTVRNTGLAPLTDFAGGGVSPPFSAGQTCAPAVAPGGSCQYVFSFSPTAAGTFKATSNSSTNAGSFSIDLQGRGRTGLFGSGQQVTPRGIDFGPVGVGTTIGPRAVNITNQSFFSAITGFAGGGVDAPFSASQNCAPALGPGQTCQYFFTFSPTAAGTFTTTSNSTNSAGSFSIALRGTGVGAGLTASPLVLDFGPVPLFTTSAPQVVTVRNTGLATLTNFAGGGVNPPFSVTQNCAGGVPPGGSCQYTFRFAPTAEGRFSAVSTSSTNGGSFSIQLYGGAFMMLYLPIVMR